ncbi:MAG: transcriptional regulator [Candidatus Latescibacterota bacterium]
MPRTVATRRDVAEHLRTPKEMAAYLEAGLSRESLCRALSGERNPSLDTILTVIGALGLELQVRPSLAAGAEEQEGQATQSRPRRGARVRRRSPTHG